MQRSPNFLFATAAGLLTALACAIAWAGISAELGFRIGWMCVGVGFAVAFVIRFSADHHDEALAYLSACMSLLGCVIGNFLSTCALIAMHDATSINRVVVELLPRFSDVLARSFRPMDLAFYALAAYFGYKYARRPWKRRVT
jgi:hypothetical protein